MCHQCHHYFSRAHIGFFHGWRLNRLFGGYAVSCAVAAFLGGVGAFVCGWVWGRHRNSICEAYGIPAVRFGVSGCRKGRLLFQTDFVYAIGFAGMIAFGYSSVSGGASFLRTK